MLPCSITRLYGMVLVPEHPETSEELEWLE